MFNSKKIKELQIKELQKKVDVLSGALFEFKHKLFHERNPLRFKVGDKVIMITDFYNHPNIPRKGIVTKAHTKWPDDITGEFVNSYDVTLEDGSCWTGARDHHLKPINEKSTKTRKPSGRKSRK